MSKQDECGRPIIEEYTLCCEHCGHEILITIAGDVLAVRTHGAGIVEASLVVEPDEANPLGLLVRLREARGKHPGFGVVTAPNETSDLAESLSKLLDAGLVSREPLGENLIRWQATV